MSRFVFANYAEVVVTDQSFYEADIERVNTPLLRNYNFSELIQDMDILSLGFSFRQKLQKLPADPISLPPEFEYRPDLLAFTFYQDPDFHYLISWRNAFEDWTSYVTGVRLEMPNQTPLTGFVNELASKISLQSNLGGS